jgi:hypothetical protein
MDTTNMDAVDIKMPDVPSGECTAAKIMTEMLHILIAELAAEAVVGFLQMKSSLSMHSRTKWARRRTSW